MSRKPASVLWSLLLTAAVSGCGATHIDRYFTLANDDRSEAARETARCVLPLVIASVMVAPPYKEENIVFRSDAFEIYYYNYRYWVDPPGEMIRGLLQIRLEGSGLFQAVEPRIHSPSDHLALYVRLNALEEKDRGGEWYARLAMRFTLRTSRGDALVWRYAFDTEQRVSRRDVLGVVEALSAIYNKELDQAMISLSAFVSSHAECTGTSPGSD